MNQIRIVHQLDTMDCGPACLKMVASHYGRNYPMEYLRQEMGITREGVSLKGICIAAQKIGLQTTAYRMSMATLCEDATLPCIVHWNQNHFVVVYKIAHGKVYVADPGKGFIRYTLAEFASHWISGKNKTQAIGITLLLEPTDAFYTIPNISEHRGAGMTRLYKYITKYRLDIVKLLLGLSAVSGIQMLFPFLTQAIVDKGISGRDMHIIWLILLGEVALLTGSTIIDFIRRHILLRVSTQVNISLISDYFTKLMRLPIAFFDNKQTGDLLQRIEDHSRIEQFLTIHAPNLIFAFFSVTTLCIVLGIYSISILSVFAVGSMLYILWVTLFLRRRKILDYQFFEQQSNQKDQIYEMVDGMTEIKQQGCEQRKRLQWRQIQDRLFGINHRSLALNQTEEVGGICINELTNIIIVIITATAVIDGNLTLGMMLATQSVIGQLRGPLEDIMNMAYQWQDVRISLERIDEIYTMNEEETPQRHITAVKNMNIRLEHVSFKYNRMKEANILDDISLEIPQGRITAIVGTSGSGKTTLAKLILGQYTPLDGHIDVGDTRLEDINLAWWRQQCGVVMQDGKLFEESIAQNIALGYNEIDIPRMEYAARMANISNDIARLPMGFDTILYQGGQNLSNGQRQRLLIARAIYRMPRLFVFDEATNSLDTNNEITIVNNLQEVFQDKTVVLIAHRLSTVLHADNIVVLDNGHIAEQGTHQELIQHQGLYYKLVRNQLNIEAD